MEKDYKLRIYVYGKNALNDINHICGDLQTNIVNDIQYKIKPYHVVDKTSKWDYYLFSTEISEDSNEIIKDYILRDAKEDNILKANSEIQSVINEHENDLNNEVLNKKISKILLRYRKFYDILVIIVDNLLDEDSKLAFDFFQGFTDIKSSQPFIIFLTKKDNKPNIQSLLQLVTKEFFDKRNVYAFKFPTNEDEATKIQDFFRKCMNYYHEVTNDDKSGIQTFNILICGKAGTGKSTFINQFFQEKVAKEGEGLSVTHEITSYTHPKYPIKIFDTPGFEDDNTVKMVKRTIKKFEEDMRTSKDHLDLILYFNALTHRNFLNLEIELIKYLIGRNKKMVFVTNDFKNNKASEIERLTGIMKESLKKIIISMKMDKKLEALKIDEILNNMVLINLKQSVFEYEDEDENTKTIIKQCYGMDKLFEKINSIFDKQKISTLSIDEAKSVSEISEAIKHYELLSNIKTIEDIYVNIKINSSKKILSYSKWDFFIPFFRERRRKKLLDEICKLYNVEDIEDIEILFLNMRNLYNKMNEKKEIIIEFFNSIEKFKGTFSTDGFDFNAFCYNKETLLIGYLYLKQLENKIDFGKYDDKFKSFLKKLGASLNNAIDGFKELSKDWEETYKSLKKGESDKDWINRYFILKKKK